MESHRSSSIIVLAKSIGEKTKQAASPHDTLNLLGEVFLFFYTRGILV